VEVGSLAGVFGSSAVSITSLKGNLGHMEGTAGAGGLLNLSSVLEFRSAVANAQLRRLNPNLQNMIAGCHLELATDKNAVTWASTGGASSFGATGIIAHARLGTLRE